MFQRFVYGWRGVSSEKSCVDQRREVELQLPPSTIRSIMITPSTLIRASQPFIYLLAHPIDRPAIRKTPKPTRVKSFQIPASNKSHAPISATNGQLPNLARIDAITISMSFSGDRGADVAR